MGHARASLLRMSLSRTNLGLCEGPCLLYQVFCRAPPLRMVPGLALKDNGCVCGGIQNKNKKHIKTQAGHGGTHL